MLMHSIVVEMVLVLSLGMVKLIGVVPIYSVIVMFLIVGVTLASSYMMNSWVIYLLGVVYIGGVASLIVYLGAVRMFNYSVSLSWVIFIGVLASIEAIKVDEMDLIRVDA